MYEVTMPKLSDSMETGKIIEWRVSEGDTVSEGDVLAEVESDKAVMELECFAAGTVAEIRKGDDTEVPVGEVIALIDESGSSTGGQEQQDTEPAPEEDTQQAADEPEEEPEEDEEEPEELPAEGTQKAEPKEEAIE